MKNFLEVGRNATFEVVLNLNAKTVAGFDSTGGHIVFSPREARALANLLMKHADHAEAEKRGRKAHEGITGGG